MGRPATNRLTLLVRLWAITAAIITLVAGCGSSKTTVVQAGPVRSTGRWVILPVVNNSETPQAGERLEAILDTVLRKGGVATLDRYPPPKEDDTHLVSSDRQRYEAALEWARTAKYEYAVGGSVEEWRYKSGLDAEPAIGITMRVLEVSTGKVLWAATGTRTGGGTQNTSATAVELLDSMIRELNQH
jgi:polysaccharide biosynthesis protein PelC